MNLQTELESTYCNKIGCIRSIYPPHLYCDKHQDKASTPPSLRNKEVDGVEKVCNCDCHIYKLRGKLMTKGFIHDAKCCNNMNGTLVAPQPEPANLHICDDSCRIVSAPQPDLDKELNKLMRKYKKNVYEGEVEQTIEAIKALFKNSIITKEEE